MKTIIMGLGNSLFSDDGVGLQIARVLKSKNLDAGTTIVEVSGGGLDILDIIVGFEKAIVIDAIQTGQNEPGTIYRFDIDQFLAAETSCPHEIDFITSLKLGKELGLVLPIKVIVFGIEAQNVDDLKECCSPRVRAAISTCVENILNELSIKTVSN